MSTAVYLDSAEENRTAELALRAVRLDKPWNGFEVPVVTAGEFRRFIGSWARNDPNGTWSVSGVIEGDGALIYLDECGREVWPVVDLTDDGRAVYALSGWQWLS